MQDKEIQLGQKVEDTISGFTGIVTTAGEHLTGCERYGVRPVGDSPSQSRGEEEFFFAEQLDVVEDDGSGFRDAGDDGYVDHDFELGENVRDRVTNFEGVITVINYRMWNCPSALVQSINESEESLWVDIHRIETNPDGYDYVGEFEDGLEDDDTSSSTGSIEDSMNRNDSR